MTAACFSTSTMSSFAGCVRREIPLPRTPTPEVPAITGLSGPSCAGARFHKSLVRAGPGGRSHRPTPQARLSNDHRGPNRPAVADHILNQPLGGLQVAHGERVLRAEHLQAEATGRPEGP